MGSIRLGRWTSLVTTFVVAMFCTPIAGLAVAQQSEEPVIAPDPRDQQSTKPASARLDEVVVTANRRVQNLQEIPNAIAVIDGDALEKAGAGGFEAYIFTIPGADLADNGTERKISIRGISNMAGPQVITGSASPIGIYIDDIPVQGNGVLPDLDIFDLTRIEVLKGPQGTLYGEGAQGGAIKMLLAPANSHEFQFKADLGIGEVYNGQDFSNHQKVSINIPLVDGRWGLRAVGSRRWDSGFVDYFNIPDDAANDATNLMGRVHLDGTLTDRLAASLLVMHQSQEIDQFPSVQFEEGDLRNHNDEDQFANTEFTIGGVTIDYEFRFATLTSSSSYMKSDRESESRFPFIGPVGDALLTPFIPLEETVFPSPAEKEWSEVAYDQQSFAQEFRLVSNGEGNLHWIGGLFYRYRTNAYDTLLTNDLPTIPTLQSGMLAYKGEEEFEQYAIFGELTWQMPWSLELNVGLRGFIETVSTDTTSTLRGPMAAIAVAQGESTERHFAGEADTSALTPKVSLSWQVNDDVMIYGLAANGVRSGGTNFNAPNGAIPFYEPDSLWTYELGARTQWFDGRLTANMTVFHNDWTDLQLIALDTIAIGNIPIEATITLNVASAFTQGIEFDMTLLPFEGMFANVSVFRGRGEIEAGDPRGIVPAGSRVPQMADLSYSATLRYDAPALWSDSWNIAPFIMGSTQRTGFRTFMPPQNQTTDAPSMEGFQTYSATVGLLSDRWDLSLAVTNITDERMQLGVYPTEQETKTIGRPRTIFLRFGVQY